jgi:hypothetical protein
LFGLEGVGVIGANFATFQDSHISRHGASGKMGHGFCGVDGLVAGSIFGWRLGSVYGGYTSGEWLWWLESGFELEWEGIRKGIWEGFGEGFGKSCSGWFRWLVPAGIFEVAFADGFGAFA